MSIRVRLTLWYTAVVGLILATFAVLVYAVAARQLSLQFDYTVHLQALDAARAAHGVSLGPSGDQARRLELPVASTLGGSTLYIRLVDPSGRVVAASGNAPDPLPTPPASLQAALGGGEDHVALTMLGERVELYSAPLVLEDRLVGALQVATSLRPLESSLVVLGFGLAATVVVGMLLATTFGWFLATKAMRPVDRLTRAADAIGRSADLSGRLAGPRQRDEIGRLAATFNDMLARLDRAVATQRSFLAEASHELRTPLTVIRANVETVLRAGPPDAEHHPMLHVVAREAERMGRLVADLLTLARVDAGQPLGRQRIALDTLVLEVYEQGLTLADRADVDLVVGDFEQVEVEGDPDRLKQLILNLVENAIRYTGRRGTITVDLVQRDGWATVRITDTGPGIPPEHLPRIFDRFYRVSQPQSPSSGGTGLGLAICKWVAEAHGGRIAAESEVGVGSSFTVYVPACRASGAAASSSPASVAPALTVS